MPASQAFGFKQTADQAGNAITQLVAPLDQAVLPDNCGVAAVSIGNAVSVSVTDDKGGTWIQAQAIAGGQRLSQWYREGINDAPTKLIVNFGGGGATHASCVWGQMCGVKVSGALDPTGKSTRTGSSTTPNSNAITPTNTGQVFFTAVQDSSSAVVNSWNEVSPAIARTADIAWTFVYTQVERYVSGTGPITPQCVLSPSRGWTAAAFTLIEDTTKGTAPSGFRVDSMQSTSFPSAGISAFAVQIPPVGANALLYEAQLNPGLTITALGDSNGDTWTKIADVVNNQAGRNQFWLLDNPTQADPKVVTPAFTGSTAGILITVYRLKKNNPLSTIGHDAAVTQTGNDIVNSFIVGAVVTPSKPSGLLFRLCSVQSHTIVSISAAAPTAFFVSDTSTPTIASPADMMQNNGYVITHDPAAADGLVWGMDGIPNDDAEAAVFLFEVPPAPPASGGSGSNLLMMGVG